MKSPFTCIIFFVLLFELRSFSGADPGSRRARAVYFPALIDQELMKQISPQNLDFPFANLHDLWWGGGGGVELQNSPPPMLPKGTTTTEKLPLARESHVATTSVTEAPGPSYLTESIYYFEDHTPSPELSKRQPYHPHEGNEDETFGNLQNLLYTPQYLGEKLALNPQFNPALMHYIPVDPSVPIEQVIQRAAERITIGPPTQTETSVISHDFFEQSPTPQITTDKSNRLPLTSAPSSFRRKLTGSRLRFQPRPPSPPQRISRPSQTSAPRRSSVNRAQRLPRISTRLEVATKKSNIDLLEARISTPVVPPVNERPPTKESSLLTFPVERQRLTEKKLALPRGSFFTKMSARRQQDRPDKTEKVYYTPQTNNPEEFLQRKEHNLGLNFETPEDSDFGKREKIPRGRKVSSAEEEEVPVYHTSTKSFRAPSSLHQPPIQEENVHDPSHRDFVERDPNIYVPQEYNREAIPGEPGVDYPAYISVPDTRFRCSDQAYPGLYADEDARCQVFHICQEGGREDSFVCPVGTVFNQQYFVCDWWYNFSCDQAETFYSLNAFLYEVPEDRTRSK